MPKFEKGRPITQFQRDHVNKIEQHKIKHCNLITKKSHAFKEEQSETKHSVVPRYSYIQLNLTHFCLSSTFTTKLWTHQKTQTHQTQKRQTKLSA